MVGAIGSEGIDLDQYSGCTATNCCNKRIFSEIPGPAIRRRGHRPSGALGRLVLGSVRPPGVAGNLQSQWGKGTKQSRAETIQQAVALVGHPEVNVQGGVETESKDTGPAQPS